MAVGGAGLVPGQLAQEGLGGGVVLPVDVPGDQRAPDLLVLGEAPVGLAQMRLDGGGVGLVGPLAEDAELEHRVGEDVGALLDGHVDLRQGLVPVAHVQRLGDEDLAGHDPVGRLLQEGRGARGGGLARRAVLALHRVAVVERQGDHPRLDRVGGRIGQGGVDHDAPVPLGLVPLPLLDGDGGERRAHVQVVGILLGQAQVLAVGLRDAALLGQDLGQVAPGLPMRAVIGEDVAELDGGAVEVARLAQLDAGIEERRGALLGGVAGRQHQGEGGGQEDARSHDGLVYLCRCGRVRSPVPARWVPARRVAVRARSGVGGRSRCLQAAAGDVMPPP